MRHAPHAQKLEVELVGSIPALYGSGKRGESSLISAHLCASPIGYLVTWAEGPQAFPSDKSCIFFVSAMCSCKA
eukprot:291278-Amphidinium_carterae.1